MSQDTATKPALSLKDLLARLREINLTLDVAEGRLDYLATNSPQDKAEDNQSPVADSATLDDLFNVSDRMARRANHIAKCTNIIVGN